MDSKGDISQGMIFPGQNVHPLYFVMPNIFMCNIYMFAFYRLHVYPGPYTVQAKSTINNDYVIKTLRKQSRYTVLYPVFSQASMGTNHTADIETAKI